MELSTHSCLLDKPAFDAGHRACSVLPCLALSCLALTCYIMPRLALSYRALPSSRPALSCPVLSCPVLSCPVLLCSALLCSALPCPVLPCPALTLCRVDLPCIVCRWYRYLCWCWRVASGASGLNRHQPTEGRKFPVDIHSCRLSWVGEAGTGKFRSPAAVGRYFPAAVARAGLVSASPAFINAHLMA